jgi:hypothetical protein
MPSASSYTSRSRRNTGTKVQDPYGSEEASSFNRRSGIGEILRSAGQPFDAATEARNQGYKVQGQNATWMQGGIPYSMPLSQVSRPDPYGLGDMPPLLLQSLLEDTDAMQGAADEQYGRMNERIGGMDQMVGGIQGRLQDPAQRGSRALMALLQEMENFGGMSQGAAGAASGDMLGQFDAGVAGVRRGLADAGRGTDAALRQTQTAMSGLRNVDQDVNAGYALADGAVRSFKEGMDRYQDTSAQDASAMAYAIRRSGETAKKQLEAAYNTGQIDENTYQSQMYELQMEVGNQVQSNITPVLSKFNDTMIQLEANLAGLKMDAANTRFTGASIKQKTGELRMAGAGQMMQGAAQKASLAQAGLEVDRSRADVAERAFGMRERSADRQVQMFQLRSNATQAANALFEASALNAVNLEMQGMTQTAQFVMQNPRTVVSWMQGLLAMYSARAASTGNTRLA